MHANREARQGQHIITRSTKSSSLTAQDAQSWQDGNDPCPGSLARISQDELETCVPPTVRKLETLELTGRQAHFLTPALLVAVMYKVWESQA